MSGDVALDHPDGSVGGPGEPDRSEGARPGRWLVAVALLTVAIGLAGAFRWTMIPVALDDHVRTTSVSEDGRAFEILWLRRTGPVASYRELVDRAGGAERVVGEPIHKEAWSRSVTIGGRTTDLDPPLVLWEYVGALAAVVAVAVLRARRAFPPRAR